METTKGRQKKVQGKRDTKKYKPEATENRARTQRTHETEGTQDWSEDKTNKLAKWQTQVTETVLNTQELLTDGTEVYEEKGWREDKDRIWKVKRDIKGNLTTKSEEHDKHTSDS